MFARDSTFSELASAFFQAFSSSFLRARMLAVSSLLSMSADDTLPVAATSSAPRFRHFRPKRFSLSAGLALALSCLTPGPQVPSTWGS